MSKPDATATTGGEDELVDYEEGDQQLTEPAAAAAASSSSSSSSTGDKDKKEKPRGSYAGIHSSGFRDFLLKEQLLMAITDCGFEHPSEVQQETIPQAVLGMDIICQAKSGMGKTAVFVLATLQQIVPQAGNVDTLVLCHTRELAFQICNEFIRFAKYFTDVKVKVFIGGMDIQQHRKLLDEETPHIVIGTPGRVLALLRENKLKLEKLKRFIMDECDQLLDSIDMRKDIQAIFRQTPHEKQVMMFSATLSKEVRPVCKKFTQNPCEIYVDDESKLTLHGLQQYYVKLMENQKNRKLNDLLDALEFNQVVIFVNSARRAKELDKLLRECNFPSMVIFGGMEQKERLERYNKFKDYKSRILVSTDIFGRGVDFERVNIVINYDMPAKGTGAGAGGADQYLHRVGRSGRFGTKGLAISFVSSQEDSEILDQVQGRFEVEIPQLPDEIDTSSYMNA